MQLGRGNSTNNTLDLLTGDDAKDKDNGDGWGDDDDFEDEAAIKQAAKISKANLKKIRDDEAKRSENFYKTFKSARPTGFA